jgi:hypothetical protein
MRTELAAVCLVAALLGATAAHAQSQPTASEIFDLRTKCHELSVKLMNTEYKNWQAWPNTDSKPWDVTENSHYSPKMNRCYSKITLSYKKPTPSTTTLIYDAQSGNELLIQDFDLRSARISGLVYDMSLYKKLSNDQSNDDQFSIDPGKVIAFEKLLMEEDN